MSIRINFQIYKYRFLLILILLLVFLLLLIKAYFNFRSDHDNRSDSEKQDYNQKCHRLYEKLRFPDKNAIVIPPPKEPPAHLKELYEQSGYMPLKVSNYFNQAYSDASSDKVEIKEIVSVGQIEGIISRIKNYEPIGPYPDTQMQIIIEKYQGKINRKSAVVIGTENPWIESLMIYYGASNVKTLDYTRKKYEKEGMEWQHVNDYLDITLNNKKFENFDIAASFSSIEHSGLGRYGDPLSPNGDLDAVNQAHCMLKPNGIFILGLPYVDRDDGYIQWNAHRVYGRKRIELMTKNWEIIDRSLSQVHLILILKKKV